MEKALPVIALIVGLIAGVLGSLAYVSAGDSAAVVGKLEQTQAELVLRDKERADHEARIGKLEKELNTMRDEVATMRGEMKRFKMQLEGGGIVGGGGNPMGIDPEQAQKILESLGGGGAFGGAGGGPGAGGMPDLSKLMKQFGGRSPSLKGMDLKQMQRFQNQAQDQLQKMMDERRRALPQDENPY